MEKMLKGQCLDIFLLLKEMSSIKNNPLKFCVARNLKAITPICEEYESDKGKYFREAVIMDEAGNPVIKSEFEQTAKELGGNVPYNFFEYESNEAFEDMLIKINKLSSEEVDAEFYVDSIARVIKVKDQDGNYVESTVEEALENNPEIDAMSIVLLSNYFLRLD